LRFIAASVDVLAAAAVETGKAAQGSPAHSRDRRQEGRLAPTAAPRCIWPCNCVGLLALLSDLLRTQTEHHIVLKNIVFVLGAIMLCQPLWAQAPTAEDEPIPRAAAVAEFEASLDFKQGRITLPNGVATVDVPDNFRYLGPEDARRVLEQGWGNPDGQGTLGMLVPVDIGVVSEGGWGVVITYDENGHVSDEDAEGIDYDALLTDMRNAMAEENAARERAGFEPLQLIGWAARPRYDKVANKLYWAKELALGDSSKHTLHYNIRLLGRRGVLIMNTVSGMNQLARVEQDMQQILAFTNFVPGQRYAEYDAHTDKLAAHGLRALVAGNVAAKNGVLTSLLVLLVASKQAVAVVAAALLVSAVVVARLMMGRRSTPA
jgi:uncharacterized membrane-anchored protein